MKNKIRAILLASMSVFLVFPGLALAESAGVTDLKVNQAIADFEAQVDGAKLFFEQSQGCLIFPRIIKVGIGIGGETGEGSLRIGDRTEAYYRTSSGSFGFQFGAQAKSMIICFMTQQSLDQFRNSSGWTVGVDGSVALIDIGGGKPLNTQTVKDPVVAFVFGSKGLMFNLTIEGTKIHKQEDKTATLGT